MTQYKDGDIALVTWNDASTAKRRDTGELDRRTSPAVMRRSSWKLATGGDLMPDQIRDPNIDIAVQPLVVVNPADEEQVDKLLGALRVADLLDVNVAMKRLADSLVEKPKEPMKEGAVVRAKCKCRGEIRLFVRNGDTDVFPHLPWKTVCGNHGWDALSDVEIKSEGWDE